MSDLVPEVCDEAAGVRVNEGNRSFQLLVLEVPRTLFDLPREDSLDPAELELEYPLPLEAGGL